jgi:site-specific DNA recombinase
MSETGGVVDVLVRAVMQAFDELHSLMSKEKGLTGMAENVKQGYRAGGRAPLGYKLEHIETGAIRDGAPVTKSRLVYGDRSSQVKAYFQKRIAGIQRAAAAAESGLAEISHTTLVGLEWNAMTYAGHTVWNVHNETLPSGGYKGGTKRRPRSEWVIGPNRHEAMITTEEAEIILSSLENSTRGQRRKNQSDYLLTGLLYNQDDVAYHGCDGIYYRAGKGKRISKDKIERLIISDTSEMCLSNAFIADLVASARTIKTTPIPDDELKMLRSERITLTDKIAKLTDVATEAESPRPWLEKIDQLEKQKVLIDERLERAESEYKAAAVLRALSETDLRAMLDEIHSNVDWQDTESVKAFLNCLVEKIVLTETPQLFCDIHYRITSGDSLASPRGFEPRSPP